MKDVRPFSPDADEEALRILDSLRSASATTETQRSFARWIRHSPENVAALLRNHMLATELKALDPEKRIDAKALIAQAKSRIRRSKIVPWPRPMPERVSPRASECLPSTRSGVEQRRSGFSRARLAFAATVAFASAIGGWFYWTYTAGVPFYETGVGQHRTVALPDGSTVTLNTQSALRVGFSRSAREVYLLRGEALFSVRHNDAVPFRVHVGATVIQDVGTRFSVLRTAGLTTVSVIEGVVDISPDRSTSSPNRLANSGPPPDVVVDTHEYRPLAQTNRVVAGEQLRIAADGKLVQRQNIDVVQATAWLRGRLVFDHATLEEIITQFNRYNRRQIVLIGDAHRERRFSGVFDATDPDSFLEYLRRDDDHLAIEKDADGLVIRGAE